MVGIYKIENTITHQLYIGQSSNIEKRWSTHKSRAADHNFNTKLYRAIREYGIENFEFSVVCKCAKKYLDAYEDFYIKRYNTIENGYNEVKVINKGKKISKTLLSKIIADLRRRELSMKDIAAKHCISYSTVNQINRGVMFHNPSISYPIRETSRTKRSD